MNPLSEFFPSSKGCIIHKRDNFDVYHCHFQRFVGKAPTVMEFGVGQGGSLDMWQNYFGAGAQINGIDINPLCQRFQSVGKRILRQPDTFIEYSKTLVDELALSVRRAILDYTLFFMV